MCSMALLKATEKLVARDIANDVSTESFEAKYTNELDKLDSIHERLLDME